MITTFGYFDKDFNVITTVEVDVHTIASSDPLAFAYGVANGKRLALRLKNMPYKEVHGSSFRELAPEYLRGFLLGCKGFLVPEGTKFRKGTEMSFFLYDKRIDPIEIIKKV